MLPLIPLLIQGATTLIPKILDVASEKKSVLEAGLEVAGELTGNKLANGSTKEDLEEQLKSASPEIQAEFIKRMMEKDKLIHREAMDWLENTNKARDMYKSTGHEEADRIASHVIKYNLPVILALVVINIMAVTYLERGEIIAIVSNFIGMAIHALFNERQSVINFFFGSSKGSRDKSKKNGETK